MLQHGVVEAVTTDINKAKEKPLEMPPLLDLVLLLIMMTMTLVLILLLLMMMMMMMTTTTAMMMKIMIMMQFLLSTTDGAVVVASVIINCKIKGIGLNTTRGISRPPQGRHILCAGLSFNSDLTA